jgi:ribosomal protein S1
MKNSGSIFKFSTTKGGFGQILDETNLFVNFELVECNYDFVRVGDEVIYDLVQIYDGSYEAINIEFRKNKILADLDRAYQSQSELKFKVILKKANGFVVDYKGVTSYIPNRELQSSTLFEGSDTMLYIKHFSHGGNIICSTSSNPNINLVAQFQKYIGKKDSFDFEIIDANNSGIIVSDSYSYSFIPNSHLGGIRKDELRQGSIIKASVIACSLQRGLVLSLRNYLLYDVLIELNDAFNKQFFLSGEIINIYDKHIIVDYKRIELVLNKNFIPFNSVINVKQNISFKIIDFSFTKAISISMMETTGNGLMNSFRNTNMYIGTVNKILHKGILVTLNERYVGFMPNHEITENWKLDVSCLKEGSIIKASITKYDCNGLFLSRIKYIKKARRRLAANKFAVNDSVVLRIYDKMAPFGVLVSNGAVKGLMPITNILPKEIIGKIDIMDFIKYCKDIFKRGAFIKCIVSDIIKDDNKVAFDLNVVEIENQDKIHRIIDYFLNNDELRSVIVEFYKNKRASINP